MAIYKVTSIDFGSTMSQLAQVYVESNDDCKTYTLLNPKLKDKDYLVADDGETDIPTVIIKKSDLNPTQLAAVNFQDNYLCGISAVKIRESLYNCKTISEFKKDFYCTDKDSDKYKNACESIGLLLKYLKKLSDSKVQNYVDAVEKTIVTMPVRSTSNERAKMKDLAQQAGWQNIEIKDEARSILRYELSCSNSPLLNKIKKLTKLQRLKVLIVDIGGSTADILISLVGPDGNGDFVADNIGQWPEIGETDTLGGIDIDKSICEWMLKNKFILKSMTDKYLSVRGYNDFRKFKEVNMNILRNGLAVESLGLLDDYESDKSDRRKPVWSDNEYEESESKLNRDIFVNEIAKEYFSKLQSAIRKTLKKCNLEESDIDYVVVSGGGSKTYGIREMLLGQLETDNPLNLEKIIKDNSLLRMDFEKPSALCAIGNVLPANNISFINHILYDYIVEVDVYELPVENASVFKQQYNNLSMMDERFNRLKLLRCIYHNKETVANIGEPLPYKSSLSVNVNIPFKNDVNYFYAVKLSVERGDVLYRQYGFDGCSLRTPTAVLNKIFGNNQDKTETPLEYKIDFSFRSDYTVFLESKFKIEGQWGMANQCATINGTKVK